MYNVLWLYLVRILLNINTKYMKKYIKSFLLPLFFIFSVLLLLQHNVYALEDAPLFNQFIKINILSDLDYEVGEVTQENISNMTYSVDVDSSGNIYSGSTLGSYYFPVMVLNPDQGVTSVATGTELNNYVYKHNSNGDLDTSFANNGVLIANCSGNREANDFIGYDYAFLPTVVKVAQDDSIYVESAFLVGTSTYGILVKSVCIQKYNSNGDFVSKIYERLPDISSFDVDDIGVDAFISGFGIYSMTITGVKHLYSGTIDNQGNLYFYSFSSTTEQISKFDPVASSTIFTFNPVPDFFASSSPAGFFVDKSENIYVLDFDPYTHENKLFKFDNNGVYQKEYPLGYAGGLINNISNLSGVSSDQAGNIYEIFFMNGDDIPQSEIFKYSSDGELLSSWTISGENLESYTEDNFPEDGIDMFIGFNLSTNENNKVLIGGNYQHSDDIEGNTGSIGNGIKIYSYPNQEEDDSDNNDNSMYNSITHTPASISCDPTLYTINGYLTPKPGSLPACGSTLISPGPATITYADGTVYHIDKNSIVNNININKNQSNSINDIFNRDLKLNSIGEDVKALQIYLNTHGYTLTNTGPGSLNNETNYFGSLTRQALIRFQKDNNITPAVGYFGPITREFIWNH